ncbi:MAG: dihydrofolate reductase [Phycisphaeraceae bacterium]|nr:dihydrofolate reductase [Phycisphaerales bacterium]QOJ17065.1 MAG: dihydrofolate reductase [Phycisphaeraceae bacterium]
MLLSLIAAISKNGVIGRDGGLPWRLPDDLRRFKHLTMGHHVVMGRRTFDEIKRPLPGRTNIVITRDRSWAHEGVQVAHSLDEAIAGISPDETEAFIIGGGEIYALALPRADRLYLTRVEATIEGDTYFPAFDASTWRLVSAEHHAADERHVHAMTFEDYVRVE